MQSDQNNFEKPDPSHNLLELNYIRLQCRRGMLELDQILLNFFNLHYKNLSTQQQQTFNYLLQQSDVDLFDWLLSKKTPIDLNLKNLIFFIKEKI